MVVQLQPLTAWHNPNFQDPVKRLLATVLSDNDLVDGPEAGEFGALFQYPTLILIDKILRKAKQHFQYLGYTAFTRIFNNSQ